MVQDRMLERARAVGSALLIRETELALLRLFGAGKLVGTVHTCIGQEFAAVAAVAALRPGDVVCSNHRGHGHFLAFTDEVEGLVAEVMGRVNGVCGGRGGSQHLYDPRGFYSNGVLGGMSAVATGMALAEQQKGSGAITCLFLGDGAFGEGVVYESLNFAAKHRLPLLIVVEDNHYSQSTAQHETLAGSIAGRAAAFGIPAATGSTEAGEPLMDMMHEAAAVARESGPHMVIVDTYRLAAHSKSDDDRDPVEIAQAEARDPLARLIAGGEPWVLDLRMRARERVDRAIAAAEASAPAQDLGLSREDPAALTWERPAPGIGNRVVEELRTGLMRLMGDEPRAIIVGEDVRSPYGGAFKVTKDLSDRYPSRVINAPISESAIIGIGSGLALRGLRPLVEIMFGDFTALVLDQVLNHASKFEYMYGGGVQVPLVVRAPMGGYRGYGPTHSQSLEKHFLGIPGTEVLALNRRQDLAALVQSLAVVKRPTLLFEYKLLYGRRVDTSPPQGFVLERSHERHPWVRIAPADARAAVTLVAFGEMLDLAEQALALLLDEHDVLAEVLAPSRLYPLDARPCVTAVRASARLVVIEEGQGYSGFGAELIARLHTAFGGMSWRAERVAAAPVPIPAARTLEETALPSPQDVVAAALRLISD